MAHSSGAFPLCLFLVTFTFLTSLSLGERHITIGVALKSNSPSYIRTSILQAIASISYPDTIISLREVTITNETTIESMCTALLADKKLGAPREINGNELTGHEYNEANSGNPSITFLLDASGIQLQSLANATNNPSAREQETSFSFNSRYAVPGITLIDSTWSRGVTVPSSEREWNLFIKTPGHVVTGSLVKDLIIEYAIRRVAILFDLSFADTQPDSLASFSSVISDAVFTAPIDISHSRNIASLISNIREYNVTNFIIMGTMETINSILDMAVDEHLINPRNTFYLVTKSRGKVKCPKCEDANLRSSSVLVIQPMIESDLWYNHTADLTTTVDTKVDSYFFYDLTRNVITSVYDMMSQGKWPQLKYGQCDSQADEKSKKRLNETLRLASEMSADGLYGKFGRFSFDLATHSSDYINHQDIRYKVVRMNFQKDAIEPLSGKIAEWAYNGQHSAGRFMYINYYKEFTFNYTRARSIVASGYDAPHATKDKQNRMRVVIYLQQPFIMKRIVDGKVSPAKIEYYGYCIDLLNLIREKMANQSADNKYGVWDWDYDLYEVPDGRFGEKKPDGKWTGIIGQIEEKKADIGLGPIAVMAERETVIDFTVPYYDLVGISILMKKPAVASHLFKFLTVLETDVWLSILGSLFAVAGFLWLYDRFSPYSYHNNKTGWADLKRRDFSYKESLWFCMTSLTPQGGGEGPQNLSGRMAAATWWAFSFIVIAAYTANLAAFLTVSRLDSNIESLEHLSHQFRIRYATQVDTEALVYFKRMAYIEHKFYQIWKNMSLNPMTPEVDRAAYSVWAYPISDKYTKILAQMYQAGMPKSYEEGVRRVLQSKSAQEGFAFIADAVSVKFAISNHCDLYSIGNEFSRKPIALAVQQNTTLKEALSSAILKLLNERRLETLKEHWWTHYKKKCEDTKKSSDGISIHNIGGVFIVIFAGVVLALITLIFEYIFLRAKRNSIKQAADYHRTYGGLKTGMVPGVLSRGRAINTLSK